jgi:hypothetical protein
MFSANHQEQNYQQEARLSTSQKLDFKGDHSKKALTVEMATKSTRQTLAILMTMQIRWCDAGRITRWSASVASCNHLEIGI